VFENENDSHVPTEFPGLFSKNIVGEWLNFSVSEKMIEHFGENEPETREESDGAHD
jgi:hypothetical protein